MALTVAEHITNVRRLSNTENNTGFVTDAEITQRLNEATSELYDLVVVAFEHYYVSQFGPFTLAGGVGSNTVALPADFYKIIGVDKDPNTLYPTTIPMLPSFRERNRAGGIHYFVQGLSTLVILPPQAGAGTFLMYYTPKAPVLAAPISPTPDVSDAVDGTLVSWFFANGAFDSSYVGATMTVSGCADAANNGTFTVMSVTDATDIVTDGAPASEAFGVAASVSFQFASTSNTLDANLAHWEEFVDVRAAIKVLTKREMDTSSLQSDLLALTARIHAMAANRSEDPSQVALADNVGRRWWVSGEDSNGG